MDTRKFIELSVEGEAAAATDYLNDLLAAKAFEALESRKQELSRTIFGGRPEVSDEVEDEEVEVVEEENKPFNVFKMSSEEEKHYDHGHKTMMDHIGDDYQKENVRTHAKMAYKKNPHPKGSNHHQAWAAGASSAHEEHSSNI